MKEYPNLYIGGQWVSPHSDNMSTVINPSTEEVCAKIASGDKADVDAAVRAAREAFDSFSQSSRESRVKLLRDVVAGIQSRADEFAEAINQEMGAPLWWAQQAQVPAGIAHFATAADVLEKFKFVEAKGTTHLRREAIGVCGMITPWNWPLNQVACKIAAALAVGCTVVLKPAEQTPLDSILLAEVIDAAGAPPGVFNLVTGSGSVVGSALSDHPEVDMVSFTGSTRAGAMVAKAAADSIKRVSQELGGKSVNLVLPDADLQESVVRAVRSLMSNAGQTCSAGSRLLVPADRQEEAIAIAKQTAESIPVALSADADAPAIGPISTQRQYEQVKKLIGVGIDEGATLVTGGVESPSGATKGFFVKPTIFANVNNAMAIAQEEIFGPVLVIIAYEDVDQAVQIANDSPYGLSGYVQGPHEQAVEVASRIRTGQVFINNAHADFNAPFGGFKQSGNGREWGEVGFDEFLEYKAVLGAEKLVPEAGAQELPSRNDNPSLGGSVVGKPKLPFGTRISYGIGHMAFGIKSNGFDYYLLAYYSQVLGLDARLVGMALLISLVFDAVSDPIVGYWSDNTESRWGRRHPFLFASAIPVSLSFLLVWSPPEGWSELAMVGYLLVLSIIIRTAISFFETPNVALAPELTEDYTERSKLISLGHFFAWSGGNLMNVAMFFVVFPMFASAAMSEAVSLRKPYEIYGMLASALILVAILIAAFGTQSRIPYLNQAPPKRNITLRLISKEIFETLSNRAFLAVFLAAILGAVALGLKASLHLYFVSYFWEFTASETGYLSLGIFVSAAIGFALAPVATRHLGKKRAAIILGMVAFLAHPIPICLRLLDLLPPNGDPFIFWFNLIFGIVDLGLIICFNILVASMLADLAEQSELETGRRSEGVLAASITFAKKSVQGLGILIASFVLYLASFPRQVDASAVPDEAIWSLGAYYVPIVTGIYLVMLAVLMNYNISRESHEENLRELKMRAAASSPESPKYDAHPDAGSDGKGAAAGK